MTNFPDFWAALAAPFRKEEEKERAGTGGKRFTYITARSCMNRLDDVCGPEGWADDYVQSEHSVLCRLTLTLPDGTRITKCDAGGHAGMDDAGDDEKSAVSDAFKRAAVKYGVGRYLYRDGVPEFVQQRTNLLGPACPSPARAAPQPRPEPPAPAPTAPPKKADSRSYWQLVLDATNRRNEAHQESISPSDTHWMLCVAASHQEKIAMSGVAPNDAIKIMDAFHANEPTFVIQSLINFVSRKITPHKVSNLFLFERDEFPFDPTIPIIDFVRFETTESGRGDFGAAMSMLELKAKEQGKQTPHRQWMEPDGRDWIMEKLRNYVSAHPCMLPPITGVPR